MEKDIGLTERMSNMENDTISRQAAIDAINRAVTKEAARWSVEELPSAQPNSKDLVEKIKNGITASDGNSEYFIGLRNGMRWCLSLIDDKEPIYESSAHPETAKRIVGKSRDGMTLWYQCDMCNEPVDVQDNYCRGCGRRLTDG